MTTYYTGGKLSDNTAAAAANLMFSRGVGTVILISVQFFKQLDVNVQFTSMSRPSGKSNITSKLSAERARADWAFSNPFIDLVQSFPGQNHLSGVEEATDIKRS